MLCEATASVLRAGFEILGLRTLERMWSSFSPLVSPHQYCTLTPPFVSHCIRMRTKQIANAAQRSSTQLFGDLFLILFRVLASCVPTAHSLRFPLSFGAERSRFSNNLVMQIADYSSNYLLYQFISLFFLNKAFHL